MHMKNRKARHGIYQINYVEMINRYCYLKNLLSRLNITVRHLHSFKICKCIAKCSYHWCWLINLIVQCFNVHCSRCFTLMFLTWYVYIVQWWYISYRICDIPLGFLWDTCILNYDKFYYTANLFILHVYKWEGTASKWFSPN